MTKKSGKAVARAIAAKPESAQDPLDLRNNPIVIFLASAVAVGGMLLIIAASAAAETAQVLEKVSRGERLDYFDWSRFQ
ncbi:hypothetical protein [Sinorhizobium americanum]|uniref:Uncharacterized protein n=1 Tax=Sinorhizobium americanum TaxID=194963 RepID=A0A4R2BTR6_9HYPH|nr:hypothetical protein [Sinorhizobium americanum]TCN30305.1 hypothetical protein EV184_108179 [Sinorhizobium americanum]